MSNSKIMTKSQRIGEMAVRYVLYNIIPPEWPARFMNTDYGIDLDVELFEFQEGRYISSGEHVFLQIKGTEQPQYGMCHIMNQKIDVIKIQLEMFELDLVKKMGSAIPVILILVDIKNNKAYHICLNDYIKKVLNIHKSNYYSQRTIIINIPIDNIISKDELDVLRWYGKRTKIYAMFHEMISDIEDLTYMNSKEFIEGGKKFVEYYRSYDLWQSKKLWYGLNHIKDLLDEMHENDYTLINIVKFMQQSVDDFVSLKDTKISENNMMLDEGVNAYTYAQKRSIFSLCETIKNYNGIFETYCREWFMPWSIFK